MRRFAIACLIRAFAVLLCVAPIFSATGQVVEIPTANFVSKPAGHLEDSSVRLELDRSHRQVTLFRGKMRVRRYPVAVGRHGWETPTGDFRVFQMQRNPVWRHPLSGEIIPSGDPRNELGHYWIAFSSSDNGVIGFHDTPHEETIGKPVSHGCVRMFEKDIAELFREVSVGTPVVVAP